MEFPNKDGKRKAYCFSNSVLRLQRALRFAGFEVIGLLNTIESIFRDGLSRFSAESENASTSFMSITGHGVKVEETPYLLPPTYPVHKGCRLLRKMPCSSMVLEMLPRRPR